MRDRAGVMLWTAFLAVVSCGSPTADPPAGEPPVVFPIADRSTAAGVPVDVSITIDDGGQAVSLSGEAANAVLVPDDGLAFSGSGGTRILTVTPTPGLSGVTAVTVTASSGGGSGSATFELSVFREPAVGGSFTWSQRLAPPESDAVDGFGWTVDASDDLIAVGTRDRSELDAAYVFRLDGPGGSWQPTIRLAEPDPFGQMALALDTYALAVSDASRTTIYAGSSVSAASWPVGGLRRRAPRGPDRRRCAGRGPRGRRVRCRLRLRAR